MKFDPMIFALVMAIGLIIVSFWRAHRDPRNSLNFFDLLLEDGKLSKVSCMVLGAFGLHSWIMITLTLSDKMTEGYLTIYGATWVAPLMARMLKPTESKPTEVKP
jgi:hypothetical protein